MKQYIDKDALVAEITHKIKVLEAFVRNFDGISDKVEKAKNNIEAFGDVLLFIENLDEVKEVDLESELNDFIEQQKAWIKDDRVVEYDNGDSFNHIYDLEKIARHFFELGLKVAQKEE